MSLIIFDMDGTLIDSGATISSRVNGAFAALGLPQPSAEAVRANVGLSLPLYMGQVADTTDEDLIARLMHAYREISALAPPGQMPLFAGAQTALQRLSMRPQTILGVATGKGRLGLDRALSQTGIGHYFKTLQTPDNNPSKPHPSMLLTAMDECGATPAETLMIGDAVFDIQMARAAGVQAIGVGWGLQSPKDLLRAGAARIIDSFDDLDAAIDELLE
ncbi:HAD-IA family hydrolase [Devosia sp.]|uniref:HAD-IA family hydrolase n=1 Tax=Devosia sp. TaxID=1871048 RepID=UPI00326429B6